MRLRQEPVTVRLDEVSRAIGGELHGPGDTRISGVSSLAEAGSEDLAFVAADRFLKDARASRAAAFIVRRPMSELQRPQIVAANPAAAFARAVQRFFTEPYPSRGIAEQVVKGAGVTIGPDSSIWPFVTLGDRVTLGARVTLFPGVFIGDDAVIGDDSILYPNVTIREGCRIGARVIIHSGTVVGSDGFGYVQDEGRHQKIPQIGIVVIEDDVELGANVTVDRATFGQTLIGRGTKVDNLVQIAHNVSIGEHSIIVAQVGIAGSTTVGRQVMVGGQAGLADHLRIEDRVLIAARSGVNRHLTAGQIVSGTPAMPHEQSIKVQAILPRLPELRQKIRELEARVRQLESHPTPTRTKKKGRR
ncbi:MAG: UDP-3-O-(3-hydroxymyristoyl)glucosamine N-acyltransferase [Nitrospirales bacterium]